MANLMLPDGAEKHLEDWTIFFLNQTPFNTIAPVLALETPEDGHGEDEEENGSESKPELLYVLNLVRTKQDKSLPRWALLDMRFLCCMSGMIDVRLWVGVRSSRLWRSVLDIRSSRYSRWALSYVGLSLSELNLVSRLV